MDFHRKYLKYKSKYQDLRNKKMAQKINAFTLDLFDNMEGASNLFSGAEIYRQIHKLSEENLETIIHTKFSNDFAKGPLLLFHEIKPIETLHTVDFFDYYEDEDLQMVEIKLLKEDYVLGILLPQLKAEYDVEFNLHYIMKHSLESIQKYIEEAKPEKLDLYIPQFDLSKKMNMAPILKKMDFEVPDVIHELSFRIETNDNSPSNSLDGASCFVFRADHPFVFYVRNTKNNMFIIFGDYQGP